MPDTPNPNEPERPDDQPDFEAMLRSLFGTGDQADVQRALGAMGFDQVDPATMGMIGAQLKAMFSGGSADEPFNVSLATDVARKAVSAEGDATVSTVASREVQQAVQVATLWLDEVTDFAAPSAGAAALSRAEWVERTMPVWRQLVEPVAAGVGTAIQGAMREQLGGADASMMPGLPAGFDPSALLGQMEPMLQRMSGAMFGMQLGQAVGALAGDLVSGTEVDLPLVPGHVVALLPANVAAFSEGLQVDDEQVRLYLAVREAARVRLFAEVPWLGPQLVAAVQDYARDINIDTEGIESAMRGVDPSDPEALQQALSGSLFHPEPSTAQKSALTRLETYLALVEGWVDVVTRQATSGHLPQADALGESVRRRRATAGPAERTFSQLVGLELRPRRLRDATNLWAALESAGGVSLRDGAWAHPDVAPTAADLDDPLGYVERARSGDRGSEFDEALDALLREGADASGATGSATDDDTTRPDRGPDETGDDPPGAGDR
ncbi:MAG TPA: zinc-dependent metalloprotease [Segeticoccus sp.]|nr:zinc-dependent metalloprotease [Segeticoccus sp.]